MGKHAVNVNIDGKSVLISKDTRVVLVKKTEAENAVQSLAWISFKPWMKNNIIQWGNDYAVCISDIVGSDSKGAMILQNDLYREKGAGWFHEHIGMFDP